ARSNAFLAGGLMSRNVRSAVLVATIMSAASVAAQQQKALPAPYETDSVTNRSRVVPRPAGAQLKVPAGFTVDEWASGFAKPRFMVEGSRGEIIVSDSGADPAQGAPRTTNGAVYVVPPGGNASTKP